MKSITRRAALAAGIVGIAGLSGAAGAYVGRKTRFRSPAFSSRLLAGKTIVNFGDSLWFDERPECDMGLMISETTGAEDVRVGFGGCVMSTHGDPYYDKFSMSILADTIVSGDWSDQKAAAAELLSRDKVTFYPPLNRLMDIDFKGVDIVTISYGTNDFGEDVRGGIGPDGSTDRACFAGAINHVVSTIRRAYPHIEIVFLTPIWRAEIPPNYEAIGNSDKQPNSLGIYLREYVDCIKRLAVQDHVHVFDLYSRSGVNPETRTIMLADGQVHPSPIGYRAIATLISVFLATNFSA